MLEVADVCILCGEVHPVRNYGLRHGEHGECPKVIMGRFPMITRPDGEEVMDERSLRGSATQRIRDYETPQAPHVPRSDGHPRLGADLETRSRTMGLPWLPPPDLGTVV